MTTSPRPFPFDAGIAELPQALDCEQAGALLGRHLRTAADEAVEVEDCRVVRLRYRPEQRCVVQYAVKVRDPRTSTSVLELVTGTIYADSGRAARRAERLSGSEFIPELNMVVRIFPSDRKLQHAHTLVSAEDPELKAAVIGAFGHGAWSVERWTTDVVRYREGLSLVVRYTVGAREAHTRSVRQLTFYAKAYPDREAAQRAFAFLEELARYAAASGRLGSMQGPIAWIDHLGCVLFAATPGRPLTEVLDSADEPGLLAAIDDTAGALGRFNVSDAPMARQFSVADYLHSLRRPVAILERACPEIAPDLGRIIDATRGLRDGERRPTHRDMKPEHVLVGPRGPTFIDLDSCAAADPVLDVALMLARFAAIARDGGQRRRMGVIASAFARRYFADVPATWRDRLPVYLAASLMEVAAGLFHRQERNWRSDVPKLIATSREVLLNRACPTASIDCLTSGA